MQVLEHLGFALGLASISGVNLYLTVLITGLMVRFNLLHLAEMHQDLEVLGHPWVIGVAAVMYVIEFVADKVPWLDSVWDAIHTFIRPVGGALLAIQALGDMPPHMQVIAAMLGGGAALTTHTTKASTRLIVNHSPEPASNIAVSVGEDVAVAGSSMLIFAHPVVAFVVFSALLIVLWMLLPRLFRLLGRSLKFVKGKLRALCGRPPLPVGG